MRGDYLGLRRLDRMGKMERGVYVFRVSMGLEGVRGMVFRERSGVGCTRIRVEV